LIAGCKAETPTTNFPGRPVISPSSPQRYSRLKERPQRRPRTPNELRVPGKCRAGAMR
jgi:hypothetical protein